MVKRPPHRGILFGEYVGNLLRYDRTPMGQPQGVTERSHAQTPCNAS